MAYIQERINKKGKITSFTIKVHKGTDITSGKELKPYITSFKPQSEWNESKARKEAKKYSIIFEKECKDGILSDNKVIVSLSYTSRRSKPSSKFSNISL